MISIKSKSEIKVMREGGRKLAGIMNDLIKASQPGVTTFEINKLAEKLVFDNNGRPSFKDYEGASGRRFPAAICASLNNEVVHGTPKSKVILKNGDIFKIDIGLEYGGLHTDMARSIAIGNCSEQIYKLIRVTEKSFWEGIKKLKAGEKLSTYSKTAQKCVEKEGFAIVRNLVGHGIGRILHEDPMIPNYFNKKYQDLVLRAGMTLAIEPMVNAGGFQTVLGSDGWVFLTRDGSLSAHYENTVLITKDGVEVLTVA